MIYTVLFCMWLIILAFQDFKYRAVTWYLFPVGFGLLFLQALFENYTNHLVYNSLYNIGFVVIQLSIVTIYFSIKHRHFVNIFRDYFGIGDLFFLMVIALAFSPVNYILFVVLALFVSLAGFYVFSLFKEVKQIPLAGAMALILALIVGLTLFYPIELYSDSWVMDWII